MWLVRPLVCGEPGSRRGAAGLADGVPLANHDFLAAGSLLGPITNALAEASAPVAERGRYLAAFQYAYTIAGILAPAIVALFTYAVWLPWAIVAAASLAAIGGSRWLASRLPAAAVFTARATVSADPSCRSVRLSVLRPGSWSGGSSYT
ncbi:MAG: hypothetical protein ACR2KG_02260 [Nocardioidaceae bacterium]